LARRQLAFVIRMMTAKAFAAKAFISVSQLHPSEANDLLRVSLEMRYTVKYRSPARYIKALEGASSSDHEVKAATELERHPLELAEINAHFAGNREPRRDRRQGRGPLLE
jgi:hypothetical protein